MKFDPAARAQLIALSFLMTASASLALMAAPVERDPVQSPKQVAAIDGITATEQAPAPAAIAPRPVQAAPAAPKAQATPPATKTADLSVYQGMGAWVDMYDFNRPNTLAPAAIVEELAHRGVKTLYLQTGRWNWPHDLLDPPTLAAFIELSHARGIKVVAWYLPGFADNDMEMRRSMAAINFTTPTGQMFDGFAPDIEDFRAVGKDMGRFATGIADYSRRLRAAVGPNYALGAIVVDAVNNKRAPRHWAPFPWPEIGQIYDIILPMAYWSVVKKACWMESDVATYMRDVVAETEKLMGADKPFHLIGGIADCDTGAEITRFVDVSMELKVEGASLYDFWTTHFNPGKEHIWAELKRLNSKP